MEYPFAIGNCLDFQAFLVIFQSFRRIRRRMLANSAGNRSRPSLWLTLRLRATGATGVEKMRVNWSRIDVASAQAGTRLSRYHGRPSSSR